LKRSNDISLGDAIRDFLSSYHLDEKLLEKQLMLSWEKVMGKMVSQHTTRLNISKKVLYIKVDSAALRNELSFAKENIRKALNSEVKSEVIREVVIN
jgi:hypothetical protein